MANVLVNLLKQKGYFASNGDDQPSEDDETFIGTLILRNLQILQFNSHEIFDLLTAKKDSITQTMTIGAGLYSTLALFNHSCNPDIVRYASVALLQNH